MLAAAWGPARLRACSSRTSKNVQGDERDHIIISTTYGPNPEGKFYRRFGPLLQSGGGRRLNVLVTRARQEVHLVTSIPPQAYRSLPAPQAGQVPNGGWLLFSYLHFAEELAEQYELAHRVLEQTEAAEQATVNLRKAQRPSAVAQALAYRLRDQHNIGSDVHWGNEGFCVDLALHHPHRAEDVTIGILGDGVRYQRAEDATDWDVFRTAVHESQGWKLLRLWTPHLFRDPARHLRQIEAAVAAYLETEVPPDGLPVVAPQQDGETA